MRKTRLDTSIESLFARKSPDKGRRKEVVMGLIDSRPDDKSCQKPTKSADRAAPSPEGAKAAGVPVTSQETPNPVASLASIWTEVTSVMVFWLPMFFTKKMMETLGAMASAFQQTLWSPYSRKRS